MFLSALGVVGISRMYLLLSGNHIPLSIPRCWMSGLRVNYVQLKRGEKKNHNNQVICKILTQYYIIMMH